MKIKCKLVHNKKQKKVCWTDTSGGSNKWMVYEELIRTATAQDYHDYWGV